jgi:hypothetical protein
MTLRLLRAPLPIQSDAPPFDAASARVAWIGDGLRHVWEPRIAAIRDALLAIELHQLADGDVAVSAVECDGAAVAALSQQLQQLDLVAIPIGARMADDLEAPVTEDDVLRYRFALTRRDRVDELLTAMADRDVTALLRLSGHPACCARALGDCIGSGGTSPLASHVDGSLKIERDVPPEPGSVVASGVLRPLGIAATAHVACSADACRASQTLASARLALGEALGFAEAMAWLRELLAWPASYSERNGVAEMRTAVLRYVVATAPRQTTLHWHWRGGLRPVTAPKTAAAAASPTHAPVDAVATFANDAAMTYGFDSVFSWRTRLSAFIWEQSRRLRGGGSLIDLCCGDAYLLELAEFETRRLRVFGIDTRAQQITRAQARLPHRAAALQVGTIDDDLVERLGVGDGAFDIAVLRPEDLIAMPVPQRDALTAVVFKAARCVLAYVSEHALRHHGTLIEVLSRAGLRPLASPASHDISVEVRPAGWA